MAEGGAPIQGGSIEEKIDKLLSLFSSMDSRFKAVENALGNFAKDVQELKKDAVMQNEKTEKLGKEMEVQAKTAKDIKTQHDFRINNLEDRLRRRNLRLRGFKQDFGGGGRLIDALQKWLEGIGIKIDPIEIERAHWSYSRRNPQRQRDIIIAFLSERKAEELYKYLKRIADLKQDGNEIRVLKDLSWQTLQERAVLRPITSRLFQSGIKFTWTFPATILIFQGNEIHKARTLEEGKFLLQKLGIEFVQQGVGAISEAASDSSGRGTPDEEERMREEQLRDLEHQVQELRKEQRSKLRQPREKKPRK